MDNLYEGKEYFLLRTNAQEFFINEPVGWDAGFSSLSRDEDMYGFNSEFIDGAQSLKFTFSDGGGAVLEDAYAQFGGDAAVELEFGLLKSATREQQFVGTVNMNTLVDDSEGITAAVERTNFESKLRTRFNTKVALNATTDYDGNAIPQLPGNTLNLHSKTIVKTTEAKNTIPAYVFLDPNLAGSPYGYSMVHYILPTLEEQTQQELDGVQNMPLAILDHSPKDDALFQYQAAEDGLLEVYFKWYSQGGAYYTAPNVIHTGIDGMFESDTPYGPNANIWEMYVWVQRGGTIVQEIYVPAVDESHSFLFANTFHVQVLTNDQIYVGIRVKHTQNKKGAYTDTWLNTVRFRQLTTAPRSTATAYRVFDVLNQIVYSLTGLPDRVVSDFFGPGGAGYNYVLTSGYAIRKFDVQADKPVQVDLSDALGGLQDIFNIGTGFQTIGDELLMRVEPQLTFFGKGVVLEIATAFDWQELHDKESTYNEIDIGFAKYSVEENNTLDDSNTEQTWLLPITTYKARLSKKSPLISSGMLIEKQRREQFKANPSTSLPEDDSIFIVACTDVVEFPHVGFVFNEADSTVTFSKPLNLALNDAIQIVPGLNASTHQFIGEPNYALANSYFITGVFVADSGEGTVTVLQENLGGINPVFAERNQYFEKVENTIDPGGAYNLRILPHRNLYAWAPKLNVGLWHKADTDLIRNTFSKNNGALITKMYEDAPGLRLDKARQIEERADIVLADFERSLTPYSPKLMQFKSHVPYDQIKLLTQALRGELSSLENYGQIIAPDKNGQRWLCVVQKVKYTYGEGVAEFTVNKVEPC